MYICGVQKRKCKDLARQPAPTQLALYLAARGLVGEWRGSLMRYGSVLETVGYFVHTRILAIMFTHGFCCGNRV